MNEVELLEWITDVMLRLSEHPINRVNELLLHIWKQSKTSNL